MTEYENLRDAQGKLQLQIVQTVTKLKNKLFLTNDEVAKFSNELDTWSHSFENNDELLNKLLEKNPFLGVRGYFSLGTKKLVLAEKERAFQLLQALSEKSADVFQEGIKAEPSLTEKSADNLMKALKSDEMAAGLESVPGLKDLVQGMYAEILKLNKNNGSNNNDQMGNGQFLQELLLEMRAARVPLKMPRFPTQNVRKNYREWKSAVNNFKKTNNLVESVLIQHIKEACKGTDADAIVSLYSIDTDQAATILEALDQRYLVMRSILTEHIEGAVALVAPQSKGNQAKHLKEVVDTFTSLLKNVEGICRESLIAKGVMQPSNEEVLRTVNNALLVGLIWRTLDDYLKTHLSSTLNLKSMDIPDAKGLISALEKRLVATQSGDKSKSTAQVNVVAHVQKRDFGNQRGCVLCLGSTHSTATCRKLSAPRMTFGEKINLLKQNPAKKKICWVCLDKPFSTCDCKARGRKCDKCGGSHHRILCDRNGDGRKPGFALTPKAHVATAVAVNLNTIQRTVLGTALIKIKDKKGNWVVKRALFDDGAQLSFVTTETAQLLGLKTQSTYQEVRAVDGSLLPPVEKQTTIEIQSMGETLLTPFKVENVAVAKKVPLILPAQRLDLDVPEKWKNQLADPTFAEPGKIDILLGGGPWALIKLDGSVFINKTRLQNSLFGFIVQGDVPIANSYNCFTVATVLSSENAAGIRSDLRKIFEYESPIDEDEEYAENLFRAYHSRLPSGQYQVPLIWREQRELGNSYNVCFKRNERLFAKLNDVQKGQFIQVLSDYQDADIISVCPIDEEKQGGCYLPFVLVWRNKLTTPLRICLDASQKSSNGLSCNDIQLVGEKLQPDLVEQLLKFRQHPVAIISDISQMYLNILIREADRKFQRSILNLPGFTVQEIEYHTVMFGATCAPFIAQRVIKQLAVDEKITFPVAAAILDKFSYIDDITMSLRNQREAVEALSQLLGIMEAATFKLHKIASNVPEVLEIVDQEQRLSTGDSSGVTSVLGVLWDYGKTDEIFVKLDLKPILRLTKRQALSILASIFDPLGLIGPSLMKGRFIIQEIWLRDRTLNSSELAHSWDRELDDDLKESYQEWYDSFNGMENVRIQRYVGYNDKLRQEIYAFSDASLKGYGCVIYIRTIFDSGVVTFSLLCSKGRVAPVICTKSGQITDQTMPKLELNAAVLMCVTVEKVKNALDFGKNFPIFYFTDSEIVLAQISRDDTNVGVYVENRLRKIRRLSDRKQWAFVSSSENPADIISRGADLKDLKGIWEHGPLSMCDPNFVPSNKFPIALSHEGEYAVAGNVSVNITVRKDTLITINPNMPVLSKFESASQTYRIMAWVLRAVRMFRLGKLRDRESKLTVKTVMKPNCKELWDGMLVTLRIVQGMYFNNEIKSLMRGKIIMEGPLRTKNAFIDSKGILRIATRIQLEEFDYDERNPIVLPGISLKNDFEKHLSYQVIHESHVGTFHSGISHTMSEIRRKYFIPNLRTGVRNYINNCQLCVIIKAKTREQIMGNLPREIVIKSPAFFECTLDYCGPLALKTKERRLRNRDINDVVEKETYNKAWVLLIACFTTGAYHLEVVRDLTANAFLRAFDNFLATRGMPHSIRSDNASTFCRAKDLIRAVFERFKRSLEEGDAILQEYCTKKGILWKRNPPLASHHGGKHERGVRTFREMLTKVLKLGKLNFVDLHATIKRIEGMVNSRPLMRARGVFEDGDFILTPGHFLIGRPINMLPSMIFPTKATTLYEAYKIRSKIESVIWELYHTSHLQEIANRTTWFTEHNNLVEGDLVILKEENAPSLEWRKGVVSKAVVGPDGKVRVVELRTAYGVFPRSIDKVVLIPGGSVLDGEKSIEESEKADDLIEVLDNLKIHEEVISDDVVQGDITPEDIAQGVIIPEDVVQGGETPEDVEKENKTKKKIHNGPVRRSNRLAAKSLLMFCLVMSCFSFGSAQQQLRVNSSHGGGAMIYEKEIFLISEGSYHAYIVSGEPAAKDVDNIVAAFQLLDRYCKRLDDNTPTSCGMVLFDTRRHTVKAIRKIEDVTQQDFSGRLLIGIPDLKTNQVYHTSTRSKREIRNKREGWVWRFLEWAFDFGTNDSKDDLHQERSSGAIVHTIAAMKGIEKRVIDHENILDREFTKLNRELKYQESRGAYTDKNALESQFHLAAISVQSFISGILEPYGSTHVTDEDLRTIIRNVGTKIAGKGIHIPEIPIEQLRSIMKVTVRPGKVLAIVVELPLVSYEVFQRAFILPFPDLKTSTILNFMATDVAINVKLQQFFSPNEAVITKVNDTLSIAVISILNKITDKSPCAVRMVALPNQQCVVKPLQSSSDQWYETPLHNVIQFHSTKKKVLVCPSNRKEILSDFGVVTIPPSCYIETEGKIIRSSLDEVRNSKRMVKVPLDNIELLFNMSQKMTNNFSIPIPTEFKIDDTELDLAMQEALVFDYKMDTWVIVLITASSCILALSVIGILLWVTRKPKPHPERNEDTTEFELERMDITQEAGIRPTARAMTPVFLRSAL